MHLIGHQECMPVASSALGTMFSLLPAVLTASHYLLHPLLGSLPPRHGGDLS